MEQAKAIRQGDRVQPAGKGPEMTVHVVIERLAYCMWVEAGRLRQAAWRVDDLRPVAASGVLH